jgi:DUF1707 SHOCT-like domain
VRLVSDREREQAAAALRRHYLHGRLTTEQLGERVELALRARDSGGLRAAHRGLPPLWRDGDELRRTAFAARRLIVLAALGATWLAVSFVLLVLLAFTALVHGVSVVDAVVFPGAWLAATVLVWRVVRRA